MITDTSIEIDAPASTVWDVFADVERWSEWTASIQRIVALDGPSIEVGTRFKIKQPRLPNLVWKVTEVTPGSSWTWRQRSLGGTALAVHEVIPQGPERTLVRQHMDQRGPIGGLVAAMMRRTTRRYMELEGEGLKARSEQRHRDAATR